MAYARKQQVSLVCHLDDVRLAIDNTAVERVIRPLAIGLDNWLHVCASATRHRLNAQLYLRDVLYKLAINLTVPTCPTCCPKPSRRRMA